MIYILHGEDVNASYSRLTALKERFPKHQITNLDVNSTEEDFIMAASAVDLFDTHKLVVGENLISQKKVSAKDLKLIPKDVEIIFWEHKQLAPSTSRAFIVSCKVENFKPKAELFYFLDSIKPDAKTALNLLQKLDLGKEMNIIWHIAQRVLLLIIAKLNLDIETSGKIIGRKIEDWQWEKISSQASQFDLTRLKSLYSGILKLDYLVKTGKTDLNTKTLISILLLKYLAR